MMGGKIVGGAKEALDLLKSAVLASHLAVELGAIVKAAEYAHEAHAEVGQLEPYTGREYIYHLVAVATVLLEHGRPLVEVVAAVLHDTLEDTNRTFEELEREFGSAVAEIVRSVSNVSKRSDGNRAARKARDLEHLRLAGEAGSNVKMGDIAVNSATIVERDGRFARTYLHEKREQLDALPGGEKSLRLLALAAVESGLEKLARLA